MLKTLTREACLGKELLPGVIFDPEGTLSFKGRCSPENYTRFFEDLMWWVGEYIKAPAQQTTVIIDLEYIENASQILLFNLLNLLKSKQKTTTIQWFVDRDDEDLIETIESFKSLDIEIIEK